MTHTYSPKGLAILADASEGKAQWVDRAVCRGMDPGVFFPERGEATAWIKAICHTCPVERECLEYAMANHERYGIWGGTSERERKRLRRERASA